MAEVLEYSLVVMVSSLFIAGSVLTYNSFTSFESQIQFKAGTSAISQLVSEAVSNGTAEAVLSMPASHLACSSGGITISSGLSSERLSSPLPCDFSLDVPAGHHVFEFESSRTGLVLRVT